MIALDTNVLVRYLVQDDEEQGEAAARVIGTAQAEGESVFISLPVLCETFWLLDRVYRFAPKQILAVAAELVRDPGLRVERASELAAALKQYRKAEPGIVDLLIGEIARAEGCGTTYTFDRNLLQTPGFRSP